MISIFIVYALFSIGIICNKYMLASAPPFLIFSLRLLFISLSATIISILSKQKLPSIAHWYIFLPAIIFGTALPGLCRIWSLQYMPPYKLALMTNLGPFVVYFFTLLWDKNALKIKKVFGILIAFFSIIPLIIAPAPQEDLLRIYMQISLPEIIVFCALFFRAIGLFALRTLVNKHHYSPIIVNNICMIGSCLISSTLVPFEANLTPPSHIFFYYVLAIAIITSVIGHTLHTHLLKNYNIALITFCSFFLTIFTTFFDFLLFNRMITWHFFVGLIGIISGLLLFCYDDHQNRFS